MYLCPYKFWGGPNLALIFQGSFHKNKSLWNNDNSDGGSSSKLNSSWLRFTYCFRFRFRKSAIRQEVLIILDFVERSR
jgi:hypothetical protein